MMVPGYCRGVRAATRAAPAIGLRAHVGGAGPPVVLLHGLGGAASNWVEVAPLIVDRHRVVALDLPGHAGSPPVGHAPALQGFVDAVAAAVEALDAVPALIVGHSFGGHVAVWLAARRPDLVAGLLLVAPAGIGTRSRRARAAVALSTRLRPGRVVAPLGPRFARHAWFRAAVLRPFFVPDGRSVSARATRGFLAELAAHVDTRTAGRAMVADDVRKAFPDVECPALVLWGARDPQLSLDDAFAFARGLGAPLRVVADCGHLVPGERPGAVADSLAALAART
jgi:pimeloyl-ACP methyl ester carboxylesterase